MAPTRFGSPATPTHCSNVITNLLLDRYVEAAAREASLDWHDAGTGRRRRIFLGQGGVIHRCVVFATLQNCF
jgi:hypothetical protein